MLSFLLDYLSHSGVIPPGVKKFAPEDNLAFKCVCLLKALSLQNKLPGVWFHIANEGIYANAGGNSASRPIFGKKLKALGKHNGLPDYVIVTPHRTLFVELKSEKGTLTLEQRKFRKWCDAHRLSYHVIRSLEAFKDLLESELKVQI